MFFVFFQDRRVILKAFFKTDTNLNGDRRIVNYPGNPVWAEELAKIQGRY